MQYFILQLFNSIKVSFENNIRRRRESCAFDQSFDIKIIAYNYSFLDFRKYMNILY